MGGCELPGGKIDNRALQMGTTQKSAKTSFISASMFLALSIFQEAKSCSEMHEMVHQSSVFAQLPALVDEYSYVRGTLNMIS